jgi:hypothetical protein
MKTFKMKNWTKPELKSEIRDFRLDLGHAFPKSNLHFRISDLRWNFVQFFISLCLLSFLCSVPALGSAQSLADAARKERERQKEVQKEVKGPVTTFSAQGAGAVTTVTATSSSTTAQLKPFELKDNNGNDEKYWRKLFDKARSDLKQAEDQVQLLDNKIKNLNTEVLNRSDIYNRENVLGAQVSKNQKELDDAKKKVDDAKQKISDLEDELHKAGGPAGWAR